LVLLQSVRIAGLRRFEEPQTVVRRGRLTAVLGPNESGKSSLLRAVAALSGKAAWDVADFTDRLRPDETHDLLEASYIIEDADVRAVETALESRSWTGTLPGAGEIFYVQRKPSGTRIRRYRRVVHRDVSSWTQLLARLGDLAAEGAEPLNPLLTDDHHRTLCTTLEEGLPSLRERSNERLTDDQFAGVDEMRAAVEEYRNAGPSDATNELLVLFDEVLEEERKPSPWLVLIETLEQRLPRVVFFGSEHRELAEFHRFDDDPSSALENLLSAGEGQFSRLRAMAGDPDRRTELRNAEIGINRRIEALFEAWTDRQVSIAISVDQEGIEIRGTDRGAPVPSAPISQRSQGMRMFGALLAFIHAQGGGDASRPVLLIDEAEQHLHYDAQAHLVRVLGQQCAAQWVLYTTHSVGCLPEDLGTSILIVEPIARERSRISQSFWTGGPGVSPLMFALGATAFAFTPSRRVVIGEGAHEAILLPSLLKDARDGTDSDEPLGFQVVGGLSEVRPKEVARLEEEAGTVVYLLDNDAGGRLHAKKLPNVAATAGRVLFIDDAQDGPATVEDLVNPAVLADVVGRLVQQRGGRRFKPAKRSIPRRGRAAWLDDEMSKRGVELSRTRIAQALVEAETRPLVDPSRLQRVRDLHGEITALFPT
jgi:Fe-S-cluster formation regulator IscX/YfhJ